MAMAARVNRMAALRDAGATEIGAFKDAIQALQRGHTGAKREGVIHMISDQLPRWYNCSSYEAVDTDIPVDNFIPPFELQVKMLRTPWTLHWRLVHANTSEVMFTWHSAGLLGMEDGLQHSVRLVGDPNRARQLANGAILGSKVRRCEMPVAGSRSRLSMTYDADLAYDWMRFRFFEWADALEAHVRSRSDTTHRAVVLDPMCGMGWLPLLMKARLRDAVHVICTDISGDAQRLAKDNFEANGLDATFATGDLFAPLASLEQKLDAIYILPPQDTAKVSGDWHDQPLVSVFTPTDELHFFERIARELPPHMSDNTVLFLGVDYKLLEDVKARFFQSGWAMAEGETVPPAGTNMKAYLNPAVLVRLRHSGAGHVEQCDEPPSLGGRAQGEGEGQAVEPKASKMDSNAYL